MRKKKIPILLCKETNNMHRKKLPDLFDTILIAFEKGSTVSLITKTHGCTISTTSVLSNVILVNDDNISFSHGSSECYIQINNLLDLYSVQDLGKATITYVLWTDDDTRIELIFPITGNVEAVNKSDLYDKKNIFEELCKDFEKATESKTDVYIEASNSFSFDGDSKTIEEFYATTDHIWFTTANGESVWHINNMIDLTRTDDVRYTDYSFRISDTKYLVTFDK